MKSSTGTPRSPSSTRPLPTIRIQYLEPDSAGQSPGPLKLSATLRATSSVPLTSRSLLLSLLRQPFSLVLTLARVYYQAWVLHYVKRLDVFPRPEPYPRYRIGDSPVRLTPPTGVTLAEALDGNGRGSWNVIRKSWCMDS